MAHLDRHPCPANLRPCGEELAAGSTMQGSICLANLDIQILYHFCRIGSNSSLGLYPVALLLAHGSWAAEVYWSYISRKVAWHWRSTRH
jgi:hypothetical protein